MEETFDYETIKKKAGDLRHLYHKVLYNEVLPFWEKFSVDEENGGYFTCLDEKGQVFDKDKFVWLQAREVWMFSKLVNTVSNDQLKEYIEGVDPQKLKDKWFEIAKKGVDFLDKHAFEEEKGNVYFSLTNTGQPLIQPYNIFSDCFSCMSFAQFHKSSKIRLKEDPNYVSHVKERSLTCFKNIESRKSNPKGVWTKNYPGTRNESSLAVPMIDMNICLELMESFEGEESIGLTKQEIFNRIEKNLDFIFNNFVDEQKWLVHEVYPFTDTLSGRLINPGHTIECIWFILETISILLSNIQEKGTELESKLNMYVEKCEKILFSTLEFGWDQKHEGIFYFMDIDGKPPLQLEHDQKLWWVHFETLISCLMMIKFKLENKKCDRNDESIVKIWIWFEKVHDYLWKYFYDRENKGEFWGYLNRRGEVLIRCKGGKWKGCFHAPRALLMCGNLLNKISEL